ncbi:hypothetical protein ADUPG1_001266, partial [Aduncisulcus paluster]
MEGESEVLPFADFRHAQTASYGNGEGIHGECHGDDENFVKRHDKTAGNMTAGVSGKFEPSFNVYGVAVFAACFPGFVIRGIDTLADHDSGGSGMVVSSTTCGSPSSFSKSSRLI